jgi:diguanylate cyclase (GGDEF)-like protein
MTEKRRCNIQNILLDALALTKDGIGIYDENDVLIYDNQGISALFNLTPDIAVGMTFSQLVTSCYGSGKGINIEHNNIEQWLNSACSKRRQTDFRSFEVDTLTGQWYLVTEQLVHNKYLYTYVTDITDKKTNEVRLEQLSKKLQKLASTDVLTEIHNRRHFYHLANIEFNRSQRQKKDIALLLLDLDNFKQVNDQYGHAGGDKVLQLFSHHIKKILRSYDIFGRLGGEEFAILLPELTINEGMVIAQRIRKIVESMYVLHDEAKIKITVSIGLSANHQQQKHIDELIKAADIKLYQAKNAGRNQVH